MAENDFKKFNIRGAITYSDFTMGQALKSNERSDPKYKKTDDKVAPSIQLLVDKTQQDRLVKHMLDVYVPEAAARFARGETKKDAFDAKYIAKLIATLEGGEAAGWDDAPPHLPIKKVYVKTKGIAPWAVGTVKFTGTAGRDIEQLARVNSEDELKVPDPNLLSYPVLKPIGVTVHELYPGAWAYATLNLSGFMMSATNYGVSAYANTVVFLEDRDRLAGGAGLDEDDLFMDD